VATATAYIEEGTVLARRTRIDPWVQCWLADAQLRLWLATGELTTAAQWAEASGLKTDDPLSYQHDLHHINLARQLTAQGIRDPFGPHLDQALHLLDRLLRAAQAAAWKNKAIQILILEALARQAGGNENGAMAALSDALALAQSAGYVRTFIDEGTPMGRLLQQASIQGLAGDYPARLLTALANAQTVAPTPPPSDRRRERGADQDLIEHLTEREMEVLQLLPSRLTSAEIAVELVVSVHTVRSHIKNIYGKLGVHKRVEAVERAKRLGLL
jgi:LuxR family maltose regulon positive regulatory protein